MGFTHNNVVVSFDKDYKQSEYNDLAYTKYIAQQIFLKIDEAFEGLMTRDESTFTFPNITKTNNYNYMLSYNINNVEGAYFTVQLSITTAGNSPLIYIGFSYTRDKYDENHTYDQYSNLNSIVTLDRISNNYTNTSSVYTDNDGVSHTIRTFSYSFYINIAKNNSMYIFNITRASASLSRNNYAEFLGVYKNTCIAQTNRVFSNITNYINCNTIRMFYTDKIKYMQSIMMTHEGCVNDGQIIYLPVYTTSGNKYTFLRDTTPIETMIDLPYQVFPVDSIITINGKDYLVIGTNFAIEI